MNFLDSKTASDLINTMRSLFTLKCFGFWWNPKQKQTRTLYSYQWGRESAQYVSGTQFAFDRPSREEIWWDGRRQWWLNFHWYDWANQED